MKLLERPKIPGKKSSIIAQVSGFATFLPLTALFGFSDFQQLTGHAIPTYGNEFLAYGGAALASGGLWLVTQRAQERASRAHAVYTGNMSDMYLRYHLRAHSLLGTSLAANVGAMMLGFTMLGNGIIDHNAITGISGGYMTAATAIFGQKQMNNMRNHRQQIRNFLGPINL